MKNAIKIPIITLVVVILVVPALYYLLSSPQNNGLTESEAISILKAAYPEFKDYPNNNLPPQSIQTKQASNGWYVAFIQEGSGRPILEAKGFLVKNDKTISSIGEYLPKIGEDNQDYLSGNNIFNLWIK